MFRKEYDSGIRNKWYNRSSMCSYQVRPDLKSGTIVTVIMDNLVLNIWEKKK